MVDSKDRQTGLPQARMKRLVNLLLASCWLAGPVSAAPEGASTGKIRIVLVGDSTVTDNAGWGLGFKQFLADGVECLNTAQGGRSSKSFRDEGRWVKALELKGDYYLIQFGHNNEPGKPGRSTDMPTYIKDMSNYVDEARAAGAKPVLVTPLTRRQWDREHPGKIKSSLESYAAEVRKIAAEKHVPLVDLHARSIALCESLGKEGCLEFSPLKQTPDGKTDYDGTHLKANGYVLFGKLVAEELKKAVPDLAAALRDAPANASPVAAEARYDAIVSADGSGTHTTVQEAINKASPNASEAKPWVILVKPGTYREIVHVQREKRHVKLVGEDAKATKITYDLHARMPGIDGKEIGTFRTPTVTIDADDFSMEKLTLENSAGPVGQALAVSVNGDRVAFRDCIFLGHQDTVFLNRGRQYFQNCTIAGTVDFIFGGATAFFDRCTLECVNDGYITAASTPADASFGFVFSHCSIRTAKPGIKVYLGRPWRPHASTIFVNTEMPEGIRPEGWHNWGRIENEQTARYSEVNSTGPGAAPDRRVKWARPLDAAQAAELTASRVLGGWAP